MSRARLMIAAVLTALVGSATVQGEAETYPELQVRDGKTLRECRVVRVEEDSLVIAHSGGVARVSLFDLPEAVQRSHGFDPFAAMERQKARGEWQRDQKWKLFWERQAHEAGQARNAELLALRREAETQWVPVEASVLMRLKDGAVLARCRRVVFEKTKTKSKLGFIVDGPPRRTLVEFGSGPIVLTPLEPGDGFGEKWKGYVNPISEGPREFWSGGELRSASAHRAASVR